MPAHDGCAGRVRGAAVGEARMKNLTVAIWLEAFYQSFRAKYPEYVDRTAFFVDLRKSIFVVNRSLASAGAS